MMLIYQVIAAAAVVVVVGTGAYFKGRQDGAEPLVEKLAVMEASIRAAKIEGDERVARAATAGKEAQAALVKVRREMEANRETAKKTAGVAWGAYFDAVATNSVRDANDHSAEAALAACRADGAAVRGAVTQLIAAATDIHSVAVLNTEQLKQLQRWLNEVRR